MSQASKPTNKSLYLNSIKFDPKLKGSLIHKLIQNTRLILLAILALSIGGLAAFFTLPRELNPEVKIPIINIVTPLPGAAPKDVEELVTKKIEKQLINIQGLDTLSSFSQDSVSIITAQFTSSQDPDKALDKINQKLDAITDLPDDAEDPRAIKLDFNDQPVWTVALVSNTNRLSLSNTAQDIQDKLEATPGIRAVNLSGNEEEEIVISLKPDTLSQYNLSSSSISSALTGNNVNFPAGSLQVNGLGYTLAINNQLNSIEKIRSLPISVGTNTVPLGQVANVFYQTKDQPKLVNFRKNQDIRLNAIQLDIFKSDTETIAGAVEKSKLVLAQETSKINGLDFVNILNSSQEVEQSFTDLSNNFRTTIALVFLILFIFLGLRQAISASLSIPLTFLSTFVIMSITGITINFLSLFSLLLALGLVVDDAIVIVQAVSKYSLKFSPQQTGLLVFRDYVVPIWTTTITTVWAFIPLLLSTGIIGEFIKSIPIVVTATLLSSTAIAVFINLPITINLLNLKLPTRLKVLIGFLVYIAFALIIKVLTNNSPLLPFALLIYTLTTITIIFAAKDISALLNKLLKHLTKLSIPGLPKTYPKRLNQFLNNLNTKNIISYGPLNFTPIATAYHRLLNKIIHSQKNRFAIYGLSIAFIITSLGFLATGLLKNEFFPQVDAENIYINVETPPGWITADTTEILSNLEDQLVDIPEIKSIFTTTGSTIDVQNISNFSGGAAENKGYISVVLVPKEQRHRSSIEIARQLRTIADQNNSGVDVTVAELTGGPPAGAQFQINIRGEDLVVLEQISTDFTNLLEQIDGAINIDSSLKLSSGQIQVNLIPTELEERGLSAAQVGAWLRTAITGTQASDVIIQNKDRDITVTLNQTDLTLSKLQNLPLPAAFGPYTLSEIAILSLENSPSTIEREAGQRVVRVTAATNNTSSQQILKAFNQKVADYQTPPGYTWDSGGVNEENRRSVQSIIKAMGVSAVLILVTMVLQLGSFRKAFLVLTVIPLAIAGVFFNFTIFGIPLSFPALIGILALFGIVVNNSIMLIEKINQNLKADFDFYEAITDACSSRLEPIVLASITTAIGLAPITFSNPLWRGLGGSIIAGLSVSGIIILFLLPTLFVQIYQPSKQAPKQ